MREPTLNLILNYPLSLISLPWGSLNQPLLHRVIWKLRISNCLTSQDVVLMLYFDIIYALRFYVFFQTDDEIGQDFLSSWKSMSVTQDDAMDFNFDPVPSGKKKKFNFEKL